MHELGIAHSVVESAAAAARAHQLERVTVVHVRLGLLSGVIREALLFGYEIAVEDTALAGARLEIEEVPVVVWCAACGVEQTLPDPFFLMCPACGRSTPDVRLGRELELVSIEGIDENTSG